MANKILPTLPPLIQQRLIQEVLGLIPNDDDTSETEIADWVKKHAPKKVEPATKEEIAKIMQYL